MWPCGGRDVAGSSQRGTRGLRRPPSEPRVRVSVSASGIVHAVKALSSAPARLLPLGSSQFKSQLCRPLCGGLPSHPLSMTTGGGTHVPGAGRGRGIL